MAALIQEINVSEPRHIITIESPIEYTFRPRQAYIRQREVGRDTPSFEQALLDALREIRMCSWWARCAIRKRCA